VRLWSVGRQGARVYTRGLIAKIDAQMLRFLHLGRYVEGQLHTRQVASTWRSNEVVDAGIESAWQQTIARPGVRIFDGQLCRFEAFHINHESLTIDLSRTSYRIVVGTNFLHPEYADEFGAQVMANPVGVSTGLLTRDGYLMMGRRNASVAYYPDRVHPFAGSLEVEDQIDLFGNVRRELREELSLAPAEIERVVCMGVAEDSRLRHPETIYMAWTTRSRAEVDAQVHADEHHDAWSVTANADEIFEQLRSNADLTPIARAVLLAFGRDEFGVDWFHRAFPIAIQ